ncbi:MAG TPA: phosphoribosylaminoimidazolesuccinocarboxamide synthase [Patescibacteria group bacterium]|nr:phosphoribosylaminoimidazolesuccinocarboxamide synthase [Patescibacteria group bacterium]
MHIREVTPNIEYSQKVTSGKVRDTVHLGDQMLVVVSDRVSTFDYVHPNGIPGKGEILEQMSEAWLPLLPFSNQNHLIETDYRKFPKGLDREEFGGRAALVEALDMFPVELIARGYLAGSAWRDYQATGEVAGIRLPPNLRESDRLPHPIFTPSTKAAVGHDQTIDFNTMVDIIHEAYPGIDARSYAAHLRVRTIERYTAAADYAFKRGIIIADTKFEEGMRRDRRRQTILGDEILTPDSSRFWPLEDYEPGRPQKSFDKQYVRDYGVSIGWDRNSAAPALPADVVAGTIGRYKEAYRRLFGQLPAA